MRKMIQFGVILLCLATSAVASETARHAMLGEMFTANDFFGFPSRTGAPFTCDSSTIRSTYFDNTAPTAVVPYYCNGTAWTVMGGATSPLSGDFVATGGWTFGSAANAAGSVRLGETASCMVFEGATADAVESSLCATDPTSSDQVFSLPDFAGGGPYTLVTTTGTQNLTGKTLISGGVSTAFSTSGTWTGNVVWNAQITVGTAANAASSMVLTQTQGIQFEGATADLFETNLDATDPTVGDQTFHLPNLAASSSDTLVGLAAGQVLTNKTLTSPLIGTSLLPVGTGVPLGAALTPFSDLYLHGSGVYGTGSIKLTGNPNAAYTWTFANASTSVAGWGINNAYTGSNSQTAGYFQLDDGIPLLLGGTGVANGRFLVNTALTPDGEAVALGSTSNSVHIYETADGAFDFNNCSAGTSAQTDPTVCVHSHNQTTTQWVEIRHNATNGVVAVGAGGLILPGMIATAGTTPAVSNTTANSCGTTTATIAGTDTVGGITVGATAGTSCTITFVVAAPTRRICDCNNETTVGNLCSSVYLTATTSKVVGTFVAGDLVTYQCVTY